MDGSDVSCLAPPALAGTRFDLAQGTVSMEGHLLAFRGLGGSRSLSLGRGWVFDLTGGIGAAEQLRLCGKSESYRVAVEVDVMTLTHPADGTVVRLQAGRGPHLIVFDDGWARAGDLWRNMTQTSALAHLAGTRLSTDTALLTGQVQPSAHAAYMPGATTLPEGAVLQVGSLDRVETVYAADAASRISVHGVFADCAVTMQDAVVCLNRRQRGRHEGVYLIGASQVNFVDGEVSMEALRNALRPSSGALEPLLDDEVPRATTVALAIEPMTASCSESWFVGLAHGGMLSGLCVDQVIEATVTFDMAVFVSDAPRLGLRLGGLHRLARYSGSSSSDTLRFTYVVTDDDVLEISMNATQAGISVLDRLRLDIEVSDLLYDRHQIRPFPNLITTAARAASKPDTGERGSGSLCLPPDRRPRLQVGWPVKVDVNLDELESVHCV